MAKGDLSHAIVARIQIDQRSREARLRLEHVERRLLDCLLPRPSLMRRFWRDLASPREIFSRRKPRKAPRSECILSRMRGAAGAHDTVAGREVRQEGLMRAVHLRSHARIVCGTSAHA